MATIILEPGELFEHTHAGSSITFLHAGNIKCFYDSKEVLMCPGDRLEIPSGVAHVLENVGAVKAHVGCTHSPRPMPMPHPRPPRPRG